jgi:probable rRNA maturation factor
MVGFLSRVRRHRRVGGEGAVTVFCASEQDDVPLDLDRWQGLARRVLEEEGVRGAVELSLLFVEEDVISEMNRTHMGKTDPTDVLAFPIDAVMMGSSPGPGAVSRGPDRSPPDADDFPLLLGDVVVCPAVASRQAPSHAGTLDDEIALLVTHGILHVLGHDHAEPAEREIMRAKELSLLEKIYWVGPAPVGFRQEHDDQEKGDS